VRRRRHLFSPSLLARSLRDHRTRQLAGRRARGQGRQGSDPARALPGTLELAAAWFLTSIIHGGGDRVALLLYLGLPGLSGSLAGAAFGRPLLEPSGPGRDGPAALRGAAIATAALLLFAPLFAIVFKLTQPGQTNVIGLTVFVLGFSALALWWVLAAVGAFVGWSLYRWAMSTTRAAA